MTTQMTSIPASEQKAFIANFLLMLRVCEKSLQRDRDVVLKLWVEGACRIWQRMTGEIIHPAWVENGDVSGSKIPNLDKIARKDQADALHMYWLLVTSCDNEADNHKDLDLQAQVVEWYEQWNRITGATNRPGWVIRAEQKKEKAT